MDCSQSNWFSVVNTNQANELFLRLSMLCPPSREGFSMGGGAEEEGRRGLVKAYLYKPVIWVPSFMISLIYNFFLYLFHLFTQKSHLRFQFRQTGKVDTSVEIKS